MNKIIRDEFGIIGQVQLDGSVEGGDSVNWMGHHIYLTDNIEKYKYSRIFERGFGGWVRHPFPSRTYHGFGSYYKHPWDGVISRDQLTGIIAGLIAQKDYLALIRLGLNHACRLFLFSYNTRINGQDPYKSKWKFPDITFFNIWGTYLRGFGWLSWLLYPLLCVLDFHLLIDTLVSNSSDDEDQINYAIRMFISQEKVPTIVSICAFYCMDQDHLKKCLKRYWNGWRQQPMMTSLYVSRLLRINSKKKFL